ncbi:MAG: hypothetical protein V4724_36055 [Pseudomonadota bacterium]
MDYTKESALDGNAVKLRPLTLELSFRIGGPPRRRESHFAFRTAQKNGIPACAGMTD